MKIGLLPLAFILALAGCLTTTEEQVMSALYEVKTKSYQDIRGDFTIDDFVLYKRHYPFQ